MCECGDLVIMIMFLCECGDLVIIIVFLCESGDVIIMIVFETVKLIEKYMQLRRSMHHKL